MLRRDRAVSRCLETESPIVVLCAPAGYGKTTVLSQWEEADPRPFEWISLDWRHNDPALLLGSVAATLNSFEPLDEFVVAPLRTVNPNLELTTSRICDTIAARSSPFVLVIDDLHSINDPAALRLLITLIQTTPAGATTAIATRGATPAQLGRLRVQDLVTELNATDLGMTSDEAALMLSEAGLDLEPDQVEELAAHTEGWPAGLHLAALSLRDAPDVDDGIKAFCGDERVVAAYLRNEFLSGLEPADLDFLIRTSALDRLTGPLCDAVLDRRGSAEILTRLARRNLLLIPLDGREREYRYHALLREMLESKLSRLDQAEAEKIHARASRWYVSVGDYDRAVPHAIASGNAEHAADLIWDRTADYLSNGRRATHSTWLSAFTDEQVRGSAPLCVATATKYQNSGDGAQVDHWTAAAVTALQAFDRADSGALEAAARLIRATGAARDGVARMGEDVAGLTDLLPENSPWAALCRLTEGAALHLTSEDTDLARELLEDGVRRARVTSAPSVTAICGAQLALLHLGQLELEDAGEAARSASATVERFGLFDDPTLALVPAASALLDARNGRAGAAAEALKRAGPLVEQLIDFSYWYEAEVRIVMAQASVLLDDIVAARAHLGEAGRYLRRVPDAVVLTEWLQEAWQAIDTAQGIPGRWPLTPAELRLLHHLPSHLGFREVAEELFVSQNTVKTQARSIYQKLGVSSRAEAVACARSAGLLDRAGDDPRASR